MTDIALDERAKFAAQLRNAANEMRAEDHNGWPVLCDIVADYLDASPSQVAPANPAQVTDAMVEALNRFERAAMAYERLGKMTRDDEKTRVIRKDAIAELAQSRTTLLSRLRAGVQEGWRSIEIAPKDGENILYRNKFRDIGFCHWDEGYDEGDQPCWWDNEADQEVCPVIWLPADILPAFPAAPSNQGGDRG